MRLTITTALFLLSASCVHPIPVRAQTAVFPGTVVTNGQLKVMVNGMQTTLNGNLSSTATSIPVAACGTIPINSLVTIDQEIIGAANCSGNVITVATSAPGCTSGINAAVGAFIRIDVRAFFVEMSMLALIAPSMRANATR